jgi:hypothetical protein
MSETNNAQGYVEQKRASITIPYITFCWMGALSWTQQITKVQVQALVSVMKKLQIGMGE